MPNTYNSQNPQIVYAVPTPTAQGGKIISPLWHLLGRALGANKVSGGYDAQGNYTQEAPVHPTLDAIFNAGQAYNSAQAMNAGQGGTQMVQNMGTQRVRDVANADEDLLKTKQAADIATMYGVPADVSTISPTPGMTALNTVLAPKLVSNQATTAQQQGQWLNSPQAQPSLEQGFKAQAEAPAFKNYGMLPAATAPMGGGAVVATPNGTMSAIGGTPVTQSVSTGPYVTSSGQYVPSKSTQQSITTPAQIMAPVSSEEIQKAIDATSGTGGVPEVQAAPTQVQEPLQLVPPYSLLQQYINSPTHEKLQFQIQKALGLR